MRRIPRDAVVALVLMVITAAFFWTTFDVRRPPFTVVGAEVWPRVILGPMFILSVAMLVKALRDGDPSDKQTFGSFAAWFGYYQNPIVCFGLFFLFLLSLRPLGMLVAGTLFTFAMQSFLGYRTPRHFLMYAVVAFASVGGMWAIFTFGLGVQLPRGRLTGF